ncbi:hypothetical protein NDI37_00465 [Funiculus sociatus GB2-A5]|uniref:Uncharacterized protein n=1 Tax=Funiculus sociatus GB2-A5 TaxID=2933946 RepID=A0ABV0JHN5_9CYAN|nr:MULTISPECIES: hypothetical protein [unclassified Trichocoleus]MBD1904451.1 hypothetical protein [Trichocoleus sp. FACHB-832]MBD2064382.1 hypothetical protein [Trichocoleus sp. FACHB-6]
MSKIVYDVIQRFEVENGVPRLVSTNIQVIQGGEDLMSLATNLLNQLGFNEKFKVSQASQYLGYRLKNPAKGAKRYQLVLAQRKEGLCISIPKDVLEGHILEVGYWVDITDDAGVTLSPVGRIWVLPSKKDIFLNSLPVEYWDVMQVQEKTIGTVSLNRCEMVDEGLYGFCTVIPDSEIIPRDEVRIEAVSDNSSYLMLSEDKLFPYTWQASITSSEVLIEFIGYFAKILMEQP